MQLLHMKDSNRAGEVLNFTLDLWTQVDEIEMEKKYK